jgi:uncharacterized protein (DUF3820 family)
MNERTLRVSEYKFKFGKYKGKKLNEVDTVYLNFVLCKEWFHDEDKQAILNYIKLNDILPLSLTFGKYKKRVLNSIEDDSYKQFLQDNNIVHPIFL